MIDNYFACADCKIFLHAGGRWAFWTLEHPGIVKPGEPITVEAVLAAHDYWNPERDDSSEWLYSEVFPSVRFFLEEHQYHHILYGMLEEAVTAIVEELLDWMEVGYCLQPLPRYLVEVLGFTTWEQARSYLSQQAIEPWWLYPWEDMPQKAQRKFEEFVQATANS